MVTIGDKIKNLLKEKNISQSELSKLTGIRQSSISDYINNRYIPKQDKIYLIANALNVSPSHLYTLEESPNEGYYTDPEAAEFAEYLRTRPGARMLFSAAKDITKEDMEETVKYIEYLKSKHK